MAVASLFIKDTEAAELAEVATLRGVTKTTAIKDALGKERDDLQSLKRHRGDDLIARLDRYRQDHPAPSPTGLKADKAFYDALRMIFDPVSLMRPRWSRS